MSGEHVHWPFLKKKLCQVDITTSDNDDHEIEENIAHNCRINGVILMVPHIKRSFSNLYS